MVPCPSSGRCCSTWAALRGGALGARSGGTTDAKSRNTRVHPWGQTKRSLFAWGQSGKETWGFVETVCVLVEVMVSQMYMFVSTVSSTLTAICWT